MNLSKIIFSKTIFGLFLLCLFASANVFGQRGKFTKPKQVELKNTKPLKVDGNKEKETIYLLFQEDGTFYLTQKIDERAKAALIIAYKETPKFKVKKGKIEDEQLRYVLQLSGNQKATELLGVAQEPCLCRRDAQGRPIYSNFCTSRFCHANSENMRAFQRRFPRFAKWVCCDILSFLINQAEERLIATK